MAGGKTRDETVNDLLILDQTSIGNPTEEGQVRHVSSDLVAFIGGSVKSLTAGAGGGEANTGANVGTGADVFRDKVGVALNFRGIATPTTALSSTVNGDNVDLDGPGFPRCRATRLTNQSISNNSNTNVIFTTEDFDSDSMHGTGATITIPANKGGIYLLVGHVQYAGNTSGYRFMSITVNNTETVSSDGLRTDPITVSGDSWIGQVVKIQSLVASDVIRLRTKQKSGGTLTLNNSTLSVMRIGL